MTTVNGASKRQTRDVLVNKPATGFEGMAFMLFTNRDADARQS